ncbi:MAG TPA: SRPBCC family protein [Acidimicrobiales bacterium]|jgi:uncharacterized protein YndB with AHSA1/START domain|nr:SRPBCC family protein [Acidimicrobiales bacterium]
MGHQHVEATAWSSAPPAAVYQLLVDGASWPTWSGHDKVEIVERGEGDGDGVGAVRVLHRGRVRSRERIVELVPERRLVYELVGGLPLRDYRATVDLTPERGGTTIRWSSSFRAKMPGTGWLYRAVLDRFIGQAARALADRAAEVAAAGGSAGGDGPASG